MHRAFFLALFLSALSVVALTGCQSTGENGMESPVIENPVFQDVPVPRDFEQKKSSWAKKSEKFRTAHMEYTGSMSVEALTAFYQKQMAHHGWTSVSESIGINPTKMVFEKEEERCEVSFETSAGPTKLVITLGYKH